MFSDREALIKIQRLLPVLFCLLFCCAEKTPETETQSTRINASGRDFPLAVNNGKFFEKNGRLYLWGGMRDAQHFNVDNLTLNRNQFHFGIGREKFPALINPDFVNAFETDVWLPDSARVLGVHIADDIRAYPLVIVNDHEVINDTVADISLLIVYCDLADLAAVYYREIDGRVFTFGQAGYTYYDNSVWQGKDGFVLWDRESNSLWWPPIGRAVSGPMLGTYMKLLDENQWCQTTWGRWKKHYPQTKVIERYQTLRPPFQWPQYDIRPDPARWSEPVPDDAVAPRWGGNSVIIKDSRDAVIDTE